MLPTFEKTKEIETKTFDPNAPVDTNARVFYLGKKAKTKLTGYFLKGYNNETAFQNEDVMILHSVKGWDKKVKSAKTIYAKYVEKGGKKVFDKFMYDILTECHLTNEMNTAKEQDPKSMINARSIEVYVPFFLKTMTFTHEEVEYTQEVNKPVLLSLPVGDMYFPTASSGMAKQLKKQFDKKVLETSEVSLEAGDVDTTGLKLSEDKTVSKEVNELRKNQSGLKEMFEHLQPYPYAEWYEKTFGEKYVLKKREWQSNYSSKPSETEDIPF